MKNRKLHKAAILFICCLTSAITLSFLFGSKSIQVKSVKDIPNGYSFVLFPEENALIYKSKSFLKGGSLRRLERAVTVSSEELKTGIINVLLDHSSENYGYVSLSTLRFLPISDMEQNIKSWKKYLVLQGYTDGSWNYKVQRDNNKIVKLELIDSKHSRSDTFEYVTDGEQIIKIFQAKYKSGILYFIIMILFASMSLIFYFLLSLIYNQTTKVNNTSQ